MSWASRDGEIEHLREGCALVLVGLREDSACGHHLQPLQMWKAALARMRVCDEMLHLEWLCRVQQCPLIKILFFQMIICCQTHTFEEPRLLLKGHQVCQGFQYVCLFA
ncbi:hypothetical protein, variant [Spizellomyces punctatus DAOM BR117]|uniref:Uncharacterized protein n=1 Tax=Spizellomyces punctatus (strain DAOM BR117) TaxID=645134 RepID=A0A0L0HB36_SPIPD|nr:hypothetical protein, variant [Spizellomyces punctatus DAOM BR117]KNC97933.1 hypothetical protein, variant [Spizellomyces punctatus DAOM BR117]|eukprot:XP_016605973.1 hypothetical protein, variant [Spizellomyces punctatus DAOM BR117]